MAAITSSSFSCGRGWEAGRAVRQTAGGWPLWIRGPLGAPSPPVRDYAMPAVLCCAQSKTHHVCDGGRQQVQRSLLSALLAVRHVQRAHALHAVHQLVGGAALAGGREGRVRCRTRRVRVPPPCSRPHRVAPACPAPVNQFEQRRLLAPAGLALRVDLMYQVAPCRRLQRHGGCCRRAEHRPACSEQRGRVVIQAVGQNCRPWPSCISVGLRAQVGNRSRHTSPLAGEEASRERTGREAPARRSRRPPRRAGWADQTRAGSHRSAGPRAAAAQVHAFRLQPGAAPAHRTLAAGGRGAAAGTPAHLLLFQRPPRRVSRLAALCAGQAGRKGRGSARAGATQKGVNGLPAGVHASPARAERGGAPQRRPQRPQAERAPPSLKYAAPWLLTRAETPSQCRGMPGRTLPPHFQQAAPTLSSAGAPSWKRAHAHCGVICGC